MAVEYKHREYFRRRLEDSTLYTFTSVADAQTKCAFHNTYLTDQSPTVTYALENSDQTLVVTLEFADSDKQEAWKTAIDNMASLSWFADDVQWFKVEWLHADGSVSSSTEFYE